MNPLSFLLVCFAGWMNRRQQAVIEYLQEEVRTIKESCLDNMILFGESSLRETVSQFAEQHHQERNHQALENKIIRPEFAEFPQTGTMRSRRRLGGLLRYYYRDAA